MQKVDAVAKQFAMRGSEAAIDAAAGSSAATPLVELGAELGFGARLRGLFSRLTDAQLALAISAVLFAVTAWPVALTEVPPYQDLPNHLAAVTAIEHPAQYGEYVFNGFFKTNAALFTWLCLVGRVAGITVAARLFTLFVLAANALVLPRFVLELTGSRRKLIVASFFIWPMVHNWFVSMGMLDFALGVPLSLFTLMLLARHRVAPTWKTGLLVAFGALFTWYAHVFSLMVVHLLVFVHVALRPSWQARWVEGRRLFAPLAASTVLACLSVASHMTEPVGPMTGYVDLQTNIPPWEHGYNLWAEWFYGFTWMSISSLVPCLVLAYFAYKRRGEPVLFFSPAAFLVLGVFFLTVPYIATNWFHVNSRFIPYLWMAALLRVPDRMPKALFAALGVSAALYSAGMGVDFERLDRDRAEFTAGMQAVPEGARLLPLVFNRKGYSENTRSLDHAWGFYVMEKQTSAPLLFAHSRSFPVTYREPPPQQLNHLVLEHFAPHMKDAGWICGTMQKGGIAPPNCEALWRAHWKEFWATAEPAFDHVLVWDGPPAASEQIPSSYKLVFERGRLAIYARTEANRAAR